MMKMNNIQEWKRADLGEGWGCCRLDLVHETTRWKRKEFFPVRIRHWTRRYPLRRGEKQQREKEISLFHFNNGNKFTILRQFKVRSTAKYDAYSRSWLYLWILTSLWCAPISVWTTSLKIKPTLTTSTACWRYQICDKAHTRLRIKFILLIFSIVKNNEMVGREDMTSTDESLLQLWKMRNDEWMSSSGHSRRRFVSAALFLVAHFLRSLSSHPRVSRHSI